MSGVATDFLPKEEEQLPEAAETCAEEIAPPEDADPDAGTHGGGGTGGSGDDSTVLQRKLNEVLTNSRESRKPGGQSTSEELQQQLNAAFVNSRESRKGPEMYPEWMPSQNQYRGRIRSFSEAKGFGFIDCAETMQQFGRDVFVHKFQLHESGAWVGQEVLFEVELNKTGHPQARNMTLANPAEAMQQWDYSSWQYDNNMQYGGYGYDSTPMPSRSEAPSRPRETDPAVSKQNIEDMIRQCNSPARMQEIIEQYGQHFMKRHVVTALYQLGLCRQHDKKQGSLQVQESGSLTRALIDRLVHTPPEELAADEAANVQWALASLEEVKTHPRAHTYAFELGKEAKKRYMEFSPAQMATFVSALSRLVRQPSDDELVCQIVTTFSEYSSGNGAFPRFPPEELKTWTAFLQEASQPMQQRNAMQQQQQQAAMNMGGMPQNMGQMGMRPNFQQGGMGMNNANGMNMGNMNMGNMGMNPMAPGMGPGMPGCGMGGCGPNMQQRMQMPMRPPHPGLGPGPGPAGKGMKGMPGGMGDFGKGKGDPMMGGKMGMAPGKGSMMGPDVGGSLLGERTMKQGLPGVIAARGGKGKGDLDASPGKGKGEKGYKGKGKDGFNKGKGKGKDPGGKSPAAPLSERPLQPGTVS